MLAYAKHTLTTIFAAVCAVSVPSSFGAGQDDGLTKAERDLLRQTSSCQGGGKPNVEEQRILDEKTKLVVKRKNDEKATTNTEKVYDLNSRMRNICQ